PRICLIPPRGRHPSGDDSPRAQTSKGNRTGRRFAAAERLDGTDLRPFFAPSPAGGCRIHGDRCGRGSFAGSVSDGWLSLLSDAVGPPLPAGGRGRGTILRR